MDRKPPVKRDLRVLWSRRRRRADPERADLRHVPHHPVVLRRAPASGCGWFGVARAPWKSRGSGRVSSAVGGSSRMMHDVRIGVLTRYGPTRHVGGVETFNDCLQRALGPLEIFADDPPESSPSLTELSRIGLEQPVGAIRPAKE